MPKVAKLPQIDGEPGWLEIARGSAMRLGPRLKGRHEFDVTVIGAGFTGISVALRLAELDPSARIAVVDALRVGEGTSGRNAGFLIDLPHPVPAGAAGVEEAHSQYRLNRFGIERLRQFNDRYANASWSRTGKYLACHDTGNLENLDHCAHGLDRAGFSYEIVSGSDLSRRLGTDYYRAAIYTPDDILVNPAALVRGLVKALQPSVSLFENSPVHAIEYGPPHTLRFLGGTISTGKVVQATNAFAEQFGTRGARIAPVFTYASLTRPLSEAHVRQHFSGVKPWGLTSVQRAGATVRFTDDNRILVRNTSDYLPALRATHVNLERAWRRHRASFESRFPFLKNVEFEYTWGGMIAATSNREPVFADAGDGVYLTSGCNGVGVVKGTYLGYYLADFMCGIDSENLRFVLQSNPGWMPPDPLRAAMVKLRLAQDIRAAKGDI